FRDRKAKRGKEPQPVVDKGVNSMDGLLEFCGQIDWVYLNVALVNVGADIRVALRPVLDLGDAEVCADILDFFLGPSWRRGHGKEEGFISGIVVPPGKENIRVISDRTMAFVNNQEGHVPQRIATRDEIVFTTCGVAKITCALSQSVVRSAGG